MRNWLREIKLVGIKDWIWWVFVIERDEFSLTHDNYHGVGGVDKLLDDKRRAHRIEETLSK